MLAQKDIYSQTQTHTCPERETSVRSLSHVPHCDPMDYSTPGFPVHHQLPELAQSHVHRVSDAIQPSHPLSSPSPSAFSLSQNQGLFLMRDTRRDRELYIQKDRKRQTHREIQRCTETDTYTQTHKETHRDIYTETYQTHTKTHAFKNTYTHTHAGR